MQFLQQAIAFEPLKSIGQLSATLFYVLNIGPFAKDNK
jgi:hypothetical protein